MGTQILYARVWLCPEFFPSARYLSIEGYIFRYTNIGIKVELRGTGPWKLESQEES